MAQVACEVRAMGIMHIVVMLPALMATHVHIKDVNDQAMPVRGLQAYFYKVSDPDTNEHADAIMTYSDKPFTFLTGTGIGQDALSEVQQLLYKQLCISNKSDKYTRDMLKFTAAAMIKNQINMSSDLLDDVDTTVYESKRADTNAAERSFGGKDNRLRMGPTESELVTDGILCWKFNNISNKLEAFTTAEVHKMIDAYKKEKFKKEVRGRRVQRRTDRKDDVAQELERSVVAGAGILSKRERTLLGDGQELWDINNIESKLAVFSKATDRCKAMKQQWQAIKGFCTQKLKMQWMKDYSKMPGDEGELKGELKHLLQHAIMEKVRDAKATDDLERAQGGIGVAAVLVDVFDNIRPCVDPEVLRKRMQDEISGGKQENRSKRIRGQKKDHQEEQEEQAEHVAANRDGMVDSDAPGQVVAGDKEMEGSSEE